MKQQLWLRLTQYHFDDLVPSHLADHVAALFGGPDPSTRAFASKLARKLGWSAGFAVRAIEEYKKFVFLGVTSDFSVTPSKVIDQVWHEHLLFSRAYRQFCSDVLRQHFDHHPELVATAEQTGVFRAQYEATLARYEAEFAVAPPSDIWCTPKFGADDTPARGAEPPARKPAARESPTRSTRQQSTATGDDRPLYVLFGGAEGGHASHASHATRPEFGGGGGFSGGGAERSWGADSGGSDAPHGGSDAGDAGGGSGCSSSCGGGCGGE